MPVRLLGALVLCASCRFSSEIPFDENGVSAIACQDSADCPGANAVCATIDFQSSLRRCVQSQRWSTISITGLHVVGDNEQPRFRFSRQRGNSSGALTFDVAGSPESVLATIGTRNIACRVVVSPRYRCDFAVDGETPEGQELARLELRDALGRTVTDRVIVEFDFTPPRIIAESISWRIIPAPTSPLRALGPQWAPTAFATGSSFVASLAFDDPHAQNPSLRIARSEVAMARSGAAFSAVLPITPEVPEGPVSIVVSSADDVGNAESAALPLRLEKDDTPPTSAGLWSIVVERRPFAAPDAGPGAFLSRTEGLEPTSVLLASTPLTASPVGLQRVSEDGVLERFQLVIADASELLLTLVDAAGNASAPTPAQRFRLHATPGPGVIRNESTVEHRFSFLPELIIDNESRANGRALGSADGEVERVTGRPTFRRERFGKAFSFRCGAALSDTARGKMVIAGSWRGCPSNEPVLAVFKGAGLDLKSEPVAANAQHVPVYDSIRSRFTLLPAVGTVAYLMDNGVVSSFQSPKQFTSATFDPETDRVLALSVEGELYEFESMSFRVRGSAGRHSAALAYHPAMHSVLLGGGSRLIDGGQPFNDVITIDGGVVAPLPAVQRPHLQWDPHEHAMRLIAIGEVNTWLLRDNRFVSTRPFPVPVNWWAPWPARDEDVLLNPGEPEPARSTLVRGLTNVGWRPFVMSEGRMNAQLVARPERGEVLIGGGGNNDYAYTGGVAWTAGTSSGDMRGFPPVMGGTLVRQSDGGVLLVGGLTRNASTITPNLVVSRLNDSRLSFDSVWPYPRATFPTFAWALADDELLIVGKEAPRNATTFRLKLNADQTTSVQPAIAEAMLLEACATRDENGHPLMLGGFEQTCTSNSCQETPSRNAWRFDGTRWTRDSRLQLPAPRRGHVCAFDEGRKSITVYAGVEGLTPISTFREFSDGGWVTRQEYFPDGRPEQRIDSAMVFDPKSQQLVMVGGRHLDNAENLSDLWVIENSSVRPGLTWKTSLSNVGVPLAAAVKKLTLKAVAGATGASADAGRLDGFELLVWRDGRWQTVATQGASASSASTATFTADALDSTWFERHHVSVGVRSLGQRGAGEAEIVVDSLELELEYQLAP